VAIPPPIRRKCSAVITAGSLRPHIDGNLDCKVPVGEISLCIVSHIKLSSQWYSEQDGRCQGCQS